MSRLFNSFIASWRLPTISSDPGTTPGSTNQFRRLNILYNGNSTTDASGLMDAPLYLARAGDVRGGSLSNTGYAGLYWSSTFQSSGNVRVLNFNATYVNPEYQNDRYFGRSLRCVAR